MTEHHEVSEVESTEEEQADQFDSASEEEDDLLEISTVFFFFFCQLFVKVRLINQDQFKIPLIIMLPL